MFQFKVEQDTSKEVFLYNKEMNVDDASGAAYRREINDKLDKSISLMCYQILP